MHVNKFLFYVIAALIITTTFVVRRQRRINRHAKIIRTVLKGVRFGRKNTEGTREQKLDFVARSSAFQNMSWASISKACANNRRIQNEMM